MTATFLGVRHHSPACARLVAATIAELRPAHVLIEGPADVNGRLDELLLGHELPVAIFSHYRDDSGSQVSWTPLCDYSPEWVALTQGRAHGAEVRFIDLPAWHPAFAGTRNRYADAERGHEEAVERLCRDFAVDNIDTLWDHLVEIAPADGLAERLTAYFDLVRGEATAGAGDAARERHMADWVRAAVADAAGRPVLVVTGGFHTPAVRALAEQEAAAPGWPEVPGAVGESYLVPFSFRRMDSFGGYQSGMPSPGYYQRLWEHGPERAATGLVESVVARLRGRGQPVSTADLIAAKALADGLALLRGHPHPARTDVLDGLVSALVSDDLDQPLPWTTRGTLPAGTHPVVVEMVAALCGDRVGRLHPDTPAPPLVPEVLAELDRLGLDRAGRVELDLGDAEGLVRSRVLHRLRVLEIPGCTRESGPATGLDPVSVERWLLSAGELLHPALIEAGAHGATLAGAAGSALAERVTEAGGDAVALAGVLFDAVLCGTTELSEQVLRALSTGIAQARELAPLGTVLATALSLWRHDRLLGAAGTPLLGLVITEAFARVLWLAERERGAAAELSRLAALAAVRDAVWHAAELGVDRAEAAAVAARLAADPAAPADLRGAACGLGWALGAGVAPERAVLGLARPASLGDWLTGLFVLAREEVLAQGPGALLDVLDELVGGMPEAEFPVALPALRQAFAFFPPAERETIARRLAQRRRTVPALPAEQPDRASAAALEAKVTRLLAQAGLIEETG
ncbi:DUF5682 family protein [Crossiella sp. CA-258035]|uniref:DUF5682 family protein n=1 Tax=Crossiella sp. CA-258035 TaxID=2981138 RepID=UPI0024BC6A05|nr:DUF5682 family protein [Crossiella sp. CA-258035]WHT23411.1 DUF5682 family protein [Crossiella sp. CA-258035]